MTKLKRVGGGGGGLLPGGGGSRKGRGWGTGEVVGADWGKDAQV